MKSVLSLPSALLALVACASCGSQSSRVASIPATALPASCTASSPQRARADAGAPFPDVAERKALFSDLVAAVRHYHLFSDLTRKNLGRAWEDDLPELEAAFTRASDAPGLTEALAHFGHSLHDGHLWYSPAEDVGRGDRLALGLALEPEWIGGAVRYYVAEPPDPKGAAGASGVRAGDIVVSVAGIPGERLTAEHALESSENNWRGIARDVAGYLTARSTAASATKPGDEETWVLRHRDGGQATVRLAWRREPWPAGEGGPDDATVSCVTYVVLGTGFQAATLRAVMIGIVLAKRLQHSTKVYSSVGAALAALEPRSNRPEAAALLPALERFAARVER